MNIQQLFLPDRIGSYYLFRKKIVGLHVSSSKVYACLLSAEGRTLSLVETYSQEVTQEKDTQQDEVIKAVAALMKRVDTYDTVITTLPSSFVLFKELRFPFIVKEKIALALPYEIEPFLPFALSDAFFDFAQVKIDAEKNFSDIVVAAVQRRHLYDHLSLFSAAGIHHETVSVDLLNIYGLWTKVAHLYPLEESGVMTVWDETTIHIAYIQKGILKAVRSLAKNQADERKSWQVFFFTLQSFAQEYGALQKILFMNTDTTTAQQAQEQLGIPCELFDLKKVFSTLGITDKRSQQEDALDIFSFCAAYPSLFTTNFTLATEQQIQQQKSLFQQQVITTAGLTTALLCAMSIHTFLQVHKLSIAVNNTRDSIVKDLRKSFPAIKSNNLAQVLKTAKQAVTKEEGIWFSFSNQTSHSFLKYLYTLSTKIEPEVLGLQLKKMVINKDSILLEGSVRSFEAVAQLEQELKDTQLFINVPDLQSKDFIIPLTLSRQGGPS